MTLAPGATLQQYRYVIRDVLGQDGAYVSYLAEHSYLGKLLCLEGLTPQAPDHDGFNAQRKALLDRARQLSQCRHWHLAGVADAFQEDGLPYVAFERPSGISLEALLQFGKPVPEATALAYIRQAGEVVQLLHEHQMTHGNISLQTLVRSPSLKGVVLTGMRLDRAASTEPFQDVRAIAAVLWSLLTAQSIPAGVAEPQSFSYCRGQVALQPALEAAIARGLAASSENHLSIQEWLSLLPTTPALGCDSYAEGAIAPEDLFTVSSVPSYSSSVASQPSMQTPNVDARITSADQQNPSFTASDHLPPAPYPSAQPSSSSSVSAQPTVLQTVTAFQAGKTYSARKGRSYKLPLLFGMTALAAGFAGVGAGVAMRLNTGLSPLPQDAALFNREQAFPPSQQWPGQAVSELESTSGFLFEQPNSGWPVPGRSNFYIPPKPAIAPTYVEPYSSGAVSDYGSIPEFEEPAVFEDGVDGFVDPAAPGTLPTSPTTLDPALPEASYAPAPVAPRGLAEPAPVAEPPVVQPPAPEPLLPVNPPVEPLKQVPMETP